MDVAPLKAAWYAQRALRPAGRRLWIVLGLACLPWTRDLEQWRARVAFARASDTAAGAAWPLARRGLVSRPRARENGRFDGRPPVSGDKP